MVWLLPCTEYLIAVYLHFAIKELLIIGCHSRNCSVRKQKKANNVFSGQLGPNTSLREMLSPSQGRKSKTHGCIQEHGIYFYLRYY